MTMGRHQVAESTVPSPASPSGLLGVREYAFVALRSEADEFTALSTT